MLVIFNPIVIYLFIHFHQFDFLCDNSPSLMVSLDFSAWVQSFSACQTWKQKGEAEEGGGGCYHLMLSAWSPHWVRLTSTFSLSLSAVGLCFLLWSVFYTAGDPLWQWQHLDTDILSPQPPLWLAGRVTSFPMLMFSACLANCCW